MRYTARGRDNDGCRVTFQLAAIKTKCGCMWSSVMGGLNCTYSSSTNPWIANPALNRNTGSSNKSACRPKRTTTPRRATPARVGDPCSEHNHERVIYNHRMDHHRVAAVSI